MIKNHLFKSTKERFISPRVTRAVGLDLEESLLAGSIDFAPEVTSTGHETEEYSVGDYWE